MSKSVEYSLRRWHSLLFVVSLALSLPLNATGTVQIEPGQKSTFAGYTVAQGESWEEFKRIRQAGRSDADTTPVGAERAAKSPKNDASTAKQAQGAPAALAPSAQKITPGPKAMPTQRTLPAPRPVVAPPVATVATVPPGDIVYTSSPRDLRPLGKYQDRTLFQASSDVLFINAGFEETDLEIKKLDGSIVQIYNCTNSATVCAAQEGRVSPDGKKIAYSVAFGDAIFEPEEGGAKIINEVTYAHLYIYDIATGKSNLIPNQSVTTINRQPDWLSNNLLVYASNAGNKFPVKDQWNCHGGKYPDGTIRGFNNGECVSQAYPYSAAGKAMQIWKMNTDGSGRVNLTPHEMNAIRPTVLKHPKNKGRIVYSSWQTAEDKGYFGGPGPGTIVNLWWLMTIDGNGGDQTSILNAHHSGYINNQGYLDPSAYGGQGVDLLLAVRSVGEDTQGRIYVTSYYRGNHFGLGNTYRFSVSDFHVEGCSTQNCYTATITPSARPGSGQYIPKDFFSVAPFGVGQDIDQMKDGKGRAMGKMGYMAPLKNGHMMATWGQGWCYPVLEAEYANSAWLGGQPLCDRQIVELLVDRVTDPFDPKQLKVLAGDTMKNEWDAVEIAATPEPPAPAPLNSSMGCYLQVVNMRNAELSPIEPYNWDQLSYQAGVQGNAVKADDPTFHSANIKSLAIYGIELWDTTYPDPVFIDTVNYHGYKDKWLMGVMAMETDGSVKMQVPCDTPFQMSGLDARGTVIAHDTVLHSLRKGETRTCHGCHEGHSVERARAIGRTAKELFATTIAATTSPALTNRRLKVTWAQVAPILTKRCGTCHTGFNDTDGLLWSRVAADQEQLDWPWMTRKQVINGDWKLPRPYFSGLVARFPRWSPLYWYCRNQRLDGYSNADYNNDIDFKSPHSSGATAAECRTIADWINLGAGK